MKSVTIIGGGFCGTLTAVNLARLSTDSLRVNIVNKQYPLGRGVAYGTPRPEHLLNVVARNMSAFPDVPLHFVEWLRNRADFADIPLGDLREQFVPRRVFGDYLQDILFWHAQPVAGPARVQIHTVEDEVLDVAPAAQRGSRACRRRHPSGGPSRSRHGKPCAARACFRGSRTRSSRLLRQSVVRVVRKTTRLT